MSYIKGRCPDAMSCKGSTIRHIAGIARCSVIETAAKVEKVHENAPSAHGLPTCIHVCIFAVNLSLCAASAAPLTYYVRPYLIFFRSVSSVSAVYGCLIVKHQMSR